MASGAPFAATTDPYSSLVIDLSGKFIYLPNYSATARIMGWQIGATDGALVPLAGFPFDVTEAGTKPSATWVNAMKIHPVTGRLYVTHVFQPGFSVLDINPATGALTAIAGSPFSFAGDWDNQLEIHPNGNFLYTGSAANFNWDFFVFSLAASGAPTLLVSGAAALPGYGVMGDGKTAFFKFDPSGTHMLIQTGFSPRVFSYNVDPATGLLTMAAGSPFSAPVANGTYGGMGFDPGG